MDNNSVDQRIKKNCTMQKIRWGIVSTGRIAHSFAQDFKFVPNGELLAVASRSVNTAKRFAEQYQIPRYYGTYQALFEDQEIDAVYIATPHNLHYQNTMDVLKAGKAVLCEKPLTVNPEECHALKQFSEASGRYLMEAMWTYFLPAICKAQEWVTQGRIGEIKHIKADFGYPLLPYDPNRREYNRDLGGGALLEMGIYPVAIAWLFQKQDPEEIKVVSRKAPNGVEDDVNILFKYHDSVATLGTSFRCRLPNWAFIIGEGGYIAIPDFFRTRECRLYELDELVERFQDGRTSLGFNFETDAVNNDLLQNKKQSDRMPLEYSLKFQEHMAKVRELF
ncbi:Gfo/Idh/MocA family oxidoreductase [bacterium]|nr:Gfo/Idh/MocA family oxidoreductase [bacterium]